jgi:hypothetical protein
MRSQYWGMRTNKDAEHTRGRDKSVQSIRREES